MVHDPERKILRPDTISLQVRHPEPGEVRTKLKASSRELAQQAAHETWAHVQGRELTEAERGSVKRIAFVARLMDNAVRVPGTDYYVGLDPLVGLVPIYGDWFSCGVSLYVLVEAIRLGTPPDILLKMALNIGIDVAVGFIPGMGDIFDVFFKANARNAQLIQQEVLGLPPAQGDQKNQWDQLLEAIEDAEIIDEEIIDEAVVPEIDAVADDELDASDAGKVIALDPNRGQVLPARRAVQRRQRAQPRPRAMIRREASSLQKAVGYTLIFGLMTMFMVPWAFFAYMGYLMLGG